MMRKAFQHLLMGLTCLFALTACQKDETPDISGPHDTGPEGSNLPYFSILHSETIVDEPKVDGSMAVFVEQQEVFNNPIGIELRGSTSRRLFEKKSYGVEFWDARGDDISLEILDFGKEEDWVLYGPYSDKTLLRNVLIYDLSNTIGRYAAKTQISELSLNSEYQGVYIFMEKVKRDGDRLAIEPLDNAVTGGEELTGGYLLKIDKTSGGDNDESDWAGDAIYTADIGFRSAYDTNGEVLIYDPYGEKQSQETYFLYEYPRASVINDAQKDYIQQYIADFELALVSTDFSVDPRPYEAYIDIESFVDFFILNELSGNPDAYRLSTFLHKDRGGKLAMGPIWDFNLAFGLDGRSGVSTWIYQYNNFYPNDLWLVHFWWEKLMQDPKFRAAIKQRWMALRAGALATESMLAKIDGWVEVMDANGALDRNFTRWDVIGEALPFNSFVGATYDEEVDYLKNWLSERASWLDGEIGTW